MRKIVRELENRKIDYDRLIKYGFTFNDNIYKYEISIMENEFKVIIEIVDNVMTSKLIETSIDDEYFMIDVEDATGEYVGKIKEVYDNAINNIIEKCTIIDVFKSRQAQEVIQYIKEKYSDEPEYLWTKFPKNAVFRHKDNKKWYAALLVLQKCKLGIDDDRVIDILDLRNSTEEINRLIDNKNFFPGYHMNKEHWFTIPLDGTVPIEEIFKYIDISYNLK